MGNMSTYVITYHLMPDAENVIITHMAKSDEDAIVFAKQYRKDAFSIKKVVKDEATQEERYEYL